MDNIERQNGYYWVKWQNYEWEPAEYKDGYWMLTGTDLNYSDGEFLEIDERQIIRSLSDKDVEEIKYNLRKNASCQIQQTIKALDQLYFYPDTEC